MESGEIPASRITASSIWNSDGNTYGPEKGRLGNVYRWIAVESDSLPWIQVHFNYDNHIKKINIRIATWCHKCSENIVHEKILFTTEIRKEFDSTRLEMALP